MGRRRGAGGVYVLLHYLFVSQTAHLLALFGVFLGVGVKLGVRRRCSPSSLFATNYFAAIAPQGASANLPLCREWLPLAGRSLPPGRPPHRVLLPAVSAGRNPWLWLVTR